MHLIIAVVKTHVMTAEVSRGMRAHDMTIQAQSLQRGTIIEHPQVVVIIVQGNVQMMRGIGMAFFQSYRRALKLPCHDTMMARARPLQNKL